MLNIKTDSKKIKEGDTFIAIKGQVYDGHDFIDDAIKNGASKIVVEHGSYSIPTIYTENTKEWLENYLIEHYSKDIEKLTIIGVTGTNGKTTTCFLTYQQLLKLGKNACYIGTIGYYDKYEHYELPNTTPGILDLYDMLLSAIDKGIDTIVMEVSSHALELGRIKGIKLKVAAFTNLTEDHLDYHKTMDNYLNAKLKILDYIKDDGTIILNNDDPYADRFKNKGNYRTLGFSTSDITIDKFTPSLYGTDIHFTENKKNYTVKTKLRAKFNVYNYLTSVMILESLGYSSSDILAIADQIEAPHGRCEFVNYKGAVIIVDYAHTPDAVEKIITSFKDKGRIITVIGCGGDRDPYKRPIMGNIATEKSDYVIFTSDNPRTESQDKIMDDILKGVNKDNYTIENDRIKAIHLGIDMLKENDTLLVLGKGHEDYQIIGRTKHHLDDLEEIKKYINQ